MRYKRRILLINKTFQFRFILFVCSWLFALSLIYPSIIYNLFDFFVRNAALDPLGPQLEKLFATRKEMIWLLVFLQAIFVGIVFFLSLFLSHRIAGPLYKLSRYFHEAENGNIMSGLHFRQADHFQELAAGYNRMMDSISNKATSTLSVLEEAGKHMNNDEGRQQLEKAKSMIRELQAKQPENE